MFIFNTYTDLYVCMYVFYFRVFQTIRDNVICFDGRLREEYDDVFANGDVFNIAMSSTSTFANFGNTKNPHKMSVVVAPRVKHKKRQSSGR